ncbi:uncharacterized protein LOC100897496 [Galendromus occidentalis]|uniref:Uncharacterized protein LOC100897496 n=1 Tax=Galendromus occidentalis TaxID=34638 RepID=A0AAJ7L5G5_9ACAR|nr:uncharacterized protein LOC100897496 [Galendromus occidentalis]XP_018496302.1 uncharacterized protein LOC100897496 [Galendromus occidentalis]
MQRSASGKRYSPSQHPSASYMPLQKKAPTSPLEAKLKKPRRWGCCRISIALISFVFFVAFLVTIAYVFLFTDLIGHLVGSDKGMAQSSRRNSSEDVSRPSSPLPDTGSISTTAAPLRELNILVLIVDTRTHIMDNGSFKASSESWRKTELAWRDLYDKKQMTDRLKVSFCQGCRPVGVKDEDNTPTVFYTVEHLRGDTHSYNTVVFVALPTPPGEILSLLKRHGRTDTLGEICQKGTWSSTGCDFKVPRARDVLPGEKKGVYNFAIQVPSMTEKELLNYNKTVIMQKDMDTFKILISLPMAVR